MELRDALALKHLIHAERIVCGTGSDELITLICKAYCKPGDEVLYSEHGFLMYPIAALAAGANPVKVPEDNRKPKLENYVLKLTSKTKVVFVTNPGVPAGYAFTEGEIRAFHAKLPDNVILVIDAAYAEYVDLDNYTCGKNLVTEFDNIIMLRTFSKVYGLGGMRVGWSYSSKEIADVLNRVRGIFNVTLPAQKAAVAALADIEFVKKAVFMNTEQRKWIATELNKLGLIVYPSQTNFVLISFGSPEKASAALEYLKNKGILLRSMAAYALPDCLRMTVGLPEDMRTVYEALKEFICSGEA